MKMCNVICFCGILLVLAGCVDDDVGSSKAYGNIEIVTLNGISDTINCVVNPERFLPDLADCDFISAIAGVDLSSIWVYGTSSEGGMKMVNVNGVTGKVLSVTVIDTLFEIGHGKLAISFEFGVWVLGDLEGESLLLKKNEGGIVQRHIPAPPGDLFPVAVSYGGVPIAINIAGQVWYFDEESTSWLSSQKNIPFDFNESVQSDGGGLVLVDSDGQMYLIDERSVLESDSNEIGYRKVDVGPVRHYDTIRVLNKNGNSIVVYCVKSIRNHKWYLQSEKSGPFTTDSAYLMTGAKSMPVFVE